MKSLRFRFEGKVGPDIKEKLEALKKDFQKQVEEAMKKPRGLREISIRLAKAKAEVRAENLYKEFCQQKKEERKRLREERLREKQARLRPAFSAGKVKAKMLGGITCLAVIIILVVGTILLTRPSQRQTVPSPAQPLVEQAEEDLNEAIRAQEQRIKELKDYFRELTTRLAKATKKNNALSKQLAEAKKLAAEKEEEIDRLSPFEQKSQQLQQKIISLEKEKRDLIADYEEKLSKAAQELSSQKASYETQTANLKSQHEKNLAALKAELAKEIEKAMTKIASILEAYATLIEIKAKPLSVKFMEKDISENKGRAVSIEPILGQKMDEGNYISGRNFDLYESYSAAAKQLEKLLNLYINNGGVIGKWGEILKGHKELLRKFQPVK